MTDTELELPQGWITAKLQDIVQSIVDKDHTTPKYVKENGIPLISPKDFTENDINFLKPKLISKQEHEHICKKCEPKFGDLLFSRIGTIGKIRKVPENKIFNILHSIVLVRPVPSIATRDYLFYLFQTQSVQLQAKRDTKSVGTPDLGIVRIRNFDVLLPPLNEQKRIVSKIEELFSKVDSTKQSLEHTKLQLESYRYSLLRSVYSKCERKPLHTICKLISGQHILKEFCNDQKKGSSYITGPSDFGDRFPIISKWTTKPKVFGIKNDILVTVKGSGVGKLNILDQNDVCISRQLMAIRPINSKSLFVYYFLKNEFFTLQSMSKGDLPGIDRDAILKMLIGTASPEEQEQIVSQIEQGFSLIQNTTQIVNSTLQQLQTMKMSVLKQAFEGKLVPQDPNDEKR